MLMWIAEMLRKYPEIAIYLSLALGFFVGSFKFGKFSLGSVTGVLLMGVLIGQLEITISPNVKSVFFLMFLFAVGYGVGPQFFRGLKSDGLPQVFFAVLVCVCVLLSTFVAAKIAGYNIGQAAGLLSGAATISAVLGVATDTINNLGLPPDQVKEVDRCHAGGIRGDLSVRHRRLGLVPGLDRTEAPGSGPGQGVQGIRGEDGRGRRRGGRAGYLSDACVAGLSDSHRLEVHRSEARASGDRPAEGRAACLGPAAPPRWDRDGRRAEPGGGGRRRARLLRAARGAPGERGPPGQRGGRPRAARLPGGVGGRRGHPEGARGDDARGAGAASWPGSVPEQGAPGRAGDAAQRGPQDRSRRRAPDPRTEKRHGTRDRPARLRRPAHREDRRRLHGPGHRVGRARRRAQLQGGGRAAEPQHQRRGAHRRAGVWLPALGEPHLRAHSGAGALGLQQHGTDDLHRGGGDQHRPGLRQGNPGGRHQSLPLGHLRDADAVHHQHLRRASTSSSSTRASCSAPVPAPVPRPRRWARSRKRRRARSPRSAIPSPTLWATRS